MKWAVVAWLVILCSSARAGVYSEYYAYGGGASGERTSSDGYVYSGTALAGGLRVAGGGRFRVGRETDLRIGAVLDIAATYDSGGVSKPTPAVGLEVGAEQPWNACWLLGLRVSGELGAGGGAFAGQVVMAGIRFTNRRIVFGADAVFARDSDRFGFGSSSALIVGAGLRGRAASYAIATSAGVFLAVTIGFAIAFSGGGPGG